MSSEAASGTRPLAGVRVIDYSHFLAGPYLSRCLAAMGADVIKVERPTTGDASRQSPYQRQGHSGYFMQQNLGKRGLCLNIKDPRGAELFGKLLDTADVFVENYRPGALTKLGLGYTDVAARNPGIVYCSISAYGHSGPDSHRAGFGLIAEAKAGGMAMLGVPGDPPPVYGISIADMYTGIHGVAAVNAALFGRTRTGRGQHIDLALYDCMVSVHEYAVQQYLLSDGQVLPSQMGPELPGSTVYGVFRAADGYFVLAAQQEPTWRRLAMLIGGAELEADTTYYSLEGRNAHRDHLRALIEEWATSQPGVASVLEQLEAAGLACAKIQNIDDVVADPQVAARGMILDLEHPQLGPIRLPNLPFRFSEADTSPTRMAPGLGEHNAELAAELGYGDADIEELLAQGVLYTAPNEPAADEPPETS